VVSPGCELQRSVRERMSPLSIEWLGSSHFIHLGCEFRAQLRPTSAEGKTLPRTQANFGDVDRKLP